MDTCMRFAPATVTWQNWRVIMNKGGFSWNRLLGISAAKAKISRKIGIPLTRSGRQRKFGAAAGCTIIPVILAVAALVIALARL